MTTTIERRIETAAGSTLLLLSALSAGGQGTFQNLGFENTTITAILVNPLNEHYAYIATVLGWTWSPLGNAVSGHLDAISLNDIALDAVAVTRHGA